MAPEKKKLAPELERTFRDLLDQAYRDLEDARKSIAFYSEKLGIEPKDSRPVRKPPVAIAALAEVIKQQAISYDDLVDLLLHNGIAPDVTMPGGSRNAIKQGINRFLKAGFLEKDEREIVRVTTKGRDRYAFENDKWDL